MTQEDEKRERKSVPWLFRYEMVLGVLLASTSGAAILLHTFGPVPMSFTVPFVVFPTAALLVGIVFFRRRMHKPLHLLSTHLLLGAVAGLMATFVYDAVRPLLTMIFGLTFNPYRAMPLFGRLITGMPEASPIAISAGWIYHFWNGISFGMMFALFRPRGGALAGLVWAMILQGAMMAAYPSFLQARLDDPGFLLTGIVGHGLWGIVLGMILKRGNQWKIMMRMGIGLTSIFFFTLVLPQVVLAHDCSSLGDCLETAGFNGLLGIFGGFAGLITWLVSQGLLGGDTETEEGEETETETDKGEKGGAAHTEDEGSDSEGYDGPCADAMARLDLARAMFNSTMLSANILRSQLTALDAQYEQVRESYYLSGSVDVGFMAGSVWSGPLKGLLAQQVKKKISETMIKKMMESALKGLAKETVKTVTKHMLDQEAKWEDLISKPLMGSDKGISGAAKKWVETEVANGILQGELSRLGAGLDPNGPVYRALKDGLKTNVAGPLAKAFSDSISVGSSMLGAMEGIDKLAAIRKQISDLRSRLYSLENQIDLELRPDVELAKENYEGCLKSDLYKDFIKKKKARDDFMKLPSQG